MFIVPVSLPAKEAYCKSTSLWRIPYLTRCTEGHFVLGGEQPLSYTQTRKMCQRIQQDINFAKAITPR